MPFVVERVRSVCLSPSSLVILAALLAASAVPRSAFAQGATIEATPSGTALAGSTVTVKWSGPNARRDYITIVQKGAGPFEYLDYRQTSNGRAQVNPVSIVMPAQPAIVIGLVGSLVIGRIGRVEATTMTPVFDPSVYSER